VLRADLDTDPAQAARRDCRHLRPSYNLRGRG
jgi:hypothetical protein